MKIRTGRDNGHTLYLQLGETPDKGRDIPLGFVVNPHAALELTQLANLGIQARVEGIGHESEPHHFGFPAVPR